MALSAASCSDNWLDMEPSTAVETDKSINILSDVNITLNGIYTTAQESNPALPAEQWEANVHKEGSYWVPVGGYRAEVLNTTVAGATLFKNGYTTGSTDAADVSGNVQNCRDSSGKVPNYSNGIPKY